MLVHAIGANTFIIVRIMEPFWFLTAIIIMIPTIEAEELKTKADSIMLEPAQKTKPNILINAGRIIHVIR